MSVGSPIPPSDRDTLWRFVGIVSLCLSCFGALLLSGAAVVSTVIEWVKL